MAGAEALPVRVHQRVRKAAWWAPIPRKLIGVVRAIPAHRDTRTGRRNARQVRIVLLVIGLVIIIFWQSDWAILGVIPALSGLVVPLSERRRRDLTAKLRTASAPRSTVRTVDGTLRVEDDAILLMTGDDVLRRLDRGKAKIVAHDDALELREGSKKDRCVHLVTPGSAPPGEPDLWASAGLDDARRLLF